MTSNHIQTWFEVYTQCHNALKSGDSLEIESAKVAYHQTQDKCGDPPIERECFGIFHNIKSTAPVGPGTPQAEDKTARPMSLGRLLGASGGVFRLLYRCQGTSQHPPHGVSGTSR